MIGRRALGSVILLGASTACASNQQSMDALLAEVAALRAGQLELQRSQAELQAALDRIAVRVDAREGPAIGDVPASGPPPPLPRCAEQPVQQGEQLSRGDFDAALADASQIATQVRIVPSFSHGHPNGFKLFAVRPESLFARAGLRNGDVVMSVNGISLTSPERVLEVYQTLKHAGELLILVRRASHTLCLTVALD